MATQGGISGKNLCDDIKDMNGIALANIKGIDGRDRTLCTICAEINLGAGRDITASCLAGCTTTYYTHGDPSSLVVGDELYTNSACSIPVDANYYSNKCGGRAGYTYAATAGDGVIETITPCPG